MYSDMPRRPASYRLDDRILEALDRVARDNNISVNRYMENLLFSHLKQIGAIEMGAKPLGETRGSDKGERRGGKKSKKSQADPDLTQSDDGNLGLQRLPMEGNR
jgi:hypothetical protein